MCVYFARVQKLNINGYQAYLIVKRLLGTIEPIEYQIQNENQILLIYQTSRDFYIFQCFIKSCSVRVKNTSNKITSQPKTSGSSPFYIGCTAITKNHNDSLAKNESFIPK